MSRFLDERGRIFGKVNVVDILVFLAVIALIVFAVARTQATASTTVPIQVTIRAQLQREDSVGFLLAAQGILKDDTGSTLGKIEKVTARPSQEEVLNPLTGKLENQTSSFYEDVDIVVSGQAVKSGGSYSIGSVAIRHTTKVNIVGTTFAVSAVIWNWVPK